MLNQLRIKIFVLGICNILLLNSIEAQDIHFSQFYASPLMLNPAASGNFYGDQRAVVTYKNQWKSIAKPYTTYAAAFDSKIFTEKISKGSLGAGISALGDKAGDLEMGTTQMNIMLAYQAKLDDNNSLSVGLQGGLTQRSLNSSAMQWGNQDNGKSGFDASLASGEGNQFDGYAYGDFSAGIMWRYGTSQKTMTSNDAVKGDFGVAMYHINRPAGVFYSKGDDRLYSKLVTHGQALIGIKNTNMALNPKILWLHQGPSDEIMVGALVRYRLKEESRYTGLIKETALSLGGYMRMKDAFVPVLLFEMANFAIGFSYDVIISDLTQASGGNGGAEITLKFVNPSPFTTVRTKRRSLM